MTQRPDPADPVTARDRYAPLAGSLAFADFLNRYTLAGPHRGIVRALLAVPGHRVLDVCCGTGRLAGTIKDAGFDVVGVDGSATMLARARRHRPGIPFLHLDAAGMAFDREFGAATIALAVHEMSPAVRDRVWAATIRALEPGGRIVVLDFAVPERRTLLSGMAARFVDRSEARFRKIDPPHYEHFREFWDAGGLRAWIERSGARILSEERFMAGTAAVVAVTP